MPFIFDSDTLHKSIREKISSKNLQFTKLELSLIRSNEDLKQLLFDILKDLTLWSKSTLSLFEDFGEILERNFPQEIIYNYVITDIKNGMSEVSISDIIEYFSEEQYNSVVAQLKESYINGEFKFTQTTLEESDIIFTLNNDALFLLDNAICQIEELSEETFSRLEEYYKTKALIPTCFKKWTKELNCPIERYSNGLLAKTVSTIGKQNEETEAIVALIIDRVKEGKDLECFSNSFKLPSTFALEREVIIDELLKNNILPTGIMDSNYIEQHLDDVVAAVTRGAKLPVSTLWFKPDVYKFKEIINAAAFNGQFNAVLLSEFREEYYELMIQEIDKLSLVSLTTVKNNLPQSVFETLIKNMASNEDYSYLSCPSYNMPFTPELLQYLILQDAPIPKNYTSKELIKFAIENKKYSSLFSLGKIEDIIMLSDESFEEFTNYLLQNQDHLYELFNINKGKSHFLKGQRLIHFYCSTSPIFIDEIMSSINHLEEDGGYYTDELYNLVKKYYAQKYDFRIEQLERLKQYVGPIVIRYIESENIQKLLTLSDEKFDKIINLFNVGEFTKVEAESIYDGLKQYEFGKSHSEIIDIFANIKMSIQAGNNNYQALLEQIISTIDDSFYAKLIKRIKTEIKQKELENNNEEILRLEQMLNILGCLKDNPVGCIKSILEKIQNGSDEQLGYDILHFITTTYVTIEREKFRKTYDLHKDVLVPFEYDEKDYDNKVAQYVILEDIGFLSIITNIFEEKYNIPYSLSKNILKYYKYGKEGFDEEELKEIRKNIKYLIFEAREYAKTKKLYCSKEYICEKYDVRKIYNYHDAEFNLLNALLELRIDLLEKNILSNDDLYNSLLKYIEKYKLPNFPTYFNDVLNREHINISDNMMNIVGFISFYDKILQEEQRRLHAEGKKSSEFNLTISQILKYAEAFSGISNAYVQILGLEDARLIKRNPPSNSASRKTEGDIRLKESVEATLKCFKRAKVTVPTFNEIFKANDKTLRVIVGNFTHPSNLTHGERTGACMRIGGVGESLFNFCLENENGFHIRFEEPTTGEYVSRVSGFRNGNTVFLNELRCSTSKDYTNSDIEAICIEVANKIIELSKDSEYPIQNVVVHREYATKNSKLSEVSFNIENNKVGLPTFYTDIKTSGLVLATTQAPIAPIDFDKKNLPSYLPAREKVYAGYDKEKLQGMINRVHSIKLSLDDEDYRYIESLTVADNIEYGMASQDWYIYIDIDGEIHEEIIGLDQRAYEEIEIARSKIYEYVPQKENIRYTMY